MVPFGGGSELSKAERKEIATLERSGDLESGMAAFFDGIAEGDFPEPGPAISPMAEEFITTMDHLVKSGEIANIPRHDYLVTWASGGASRVAHEKAWAEDGNARKAHTENVLSGALRARHLRGGEHKCGRCVAEGRGERPGGEKGRLCTYRGPPPPNSIQKNPRGTQCTGHYGCDCRKRVAKCKHFVEPPAAADAASASTL